MKIVYHGFSFIKEIAQIKMSQARSLFVSPQRELAEIFGRTIYIFKIDLGLILNLTNEHKSLKIRNHPLFNTLEIDSERIRGDLILKPSSSLTRIIPLEDNIILGDVSLEKNQRYSKYLVSINCGFLSFNDCVHEIKIHKDEINAQFENFSSTAVVTK